MSHHGGRLPMTIPITAVSPCHQFILSEQPLLLFAQPSLLVFYVRYRRICVFYICVYILYVYMYIHACVHACVFMATEILMFFAGGRRSVASRKEVAGPPCDQNGRKWSATDSKVVVI